MQLRRVEPHMNMRERQAMGSQAGAHDRDRLAPLVIRRRVNSSFDQREHRRRLDQRMRASRHHRATKSSRRRRIALGSGQQFELMRHGCARRREHRAERLQRRQEIPAGRALEGLNFPQVAFDHRELVGQARRDSPRPRNIGASVLVVADPRCQRYQPRLDAGPLRRPMLARHPQRRPMHVLERVMRMVERLSHPRVLDLERQFVRRPMLDARRRFHPLVSSCRIERHALERLPGRQFGQATRQLERNRKRRMGREDNSEDDSVKRRAKFLEAALARLVLDQIFERALVRRRSRSHPGSS